MAVKVALPVGIMPVGNVSSLRNPLVEENRAALPQMASPDSKVTSPPDVVRVSAASPLSAASGSAPSNVQCATGVGSAGAAADAELAVPLDSAATS